MKRKTQDQTCRYIGRSPSWRLVLIMLALAVFGVAGARAQTVHVGIQTKTVDGFAKPGVKIWIGKYSVTTGEGGIGSLDIPAGSYIARSETKCRVANVAASINRNSYKIGGSQTEPVLTFSAPQEYPIGIMFELDCKKPRVRGKTKGKTTARASSAKHLIPVLEKVKRDVII